MKKTPAPQTATEELDGETDLPEGWAKAELASFASLITKGTTPTTFGFRYQPKGISFVRVENLSDGRIDRSTITTFINKEADEALKRSRLHVGDLLFSIAGTIGRTALVTAEDLPANTNQALAIVRGTESVIIPRLLCLALASSVTQQQARSDSRGGSMNNISLEDVRTMRLIIPPRAEQGRIIPRLEELLTILNRAEERLAQVPKILKAFRQSVLAAACSGRLTEDWRAKHPQGETATQLFARIRATRRTAWEYMELARMQSRGIVSKNEKWKEKYIEPNTPEISDTPDLPETWNLMGLEVLLSTGRRGIKTGPFGSSLKRQEHQAIGIPVLGIENIGEMKFIEGSKIHISPKKAEDLVEFDALPDDILISRSGTIGEVCVVPRGLGEARISTNIMRVTLQEGGMSPTKGSRNPLVPHRCSRSSRGRPQASVWPTRVRA